MSICKSIFLVIFVCRMVFAGDSISISAVGDIMLGTTYPAYALPENAGEDLFKPARPWIVSSHIRFGNFEGTFFDGAVQRDGKVPGNNRFLFKTPVAMVNVLKDAGFNVMSLSNNHIKDFGLAGIRSTKETLQSAGIQYSSKAGEIARFLVEGTKVALIATDYYKAPRSMTETADTFAEIRQLKNEGHVVIVSSHAGGEGRGAEYVSNGVEVFLGENRGDSRAFAYEAIRLGADVILMHGPHVPRGLEVFQDRLIVYSLGNFMTGKGISLEGNAKVAPLVRFEIGHRGEFKSGQIVPFIQKRVPQRIEMDPEKTAIVLMKKLSEKQFPSSRLRIQSDGRF
ncbi:MAG: CapA family protein [Bdellovibrionaceae bacterium]|nr:CapA family protein [Pseudobdellovibrionaceae bacterium]